MIGRNDALPWALYSTTTSSPEFASSHADVVPPICTINDIVLNKILLSLCRQCHHVISTHCAVRRSKYWVWIERVPDKLKNAACELYPTESIPPQSGILTTPPVRDNHLLPLPQYMYRTLSYYHWSIETYGNVGIGWKSSENREEAATIGCVPIMRIWSIAHSSLPLPLCDNCLHRRTVLAVLEADSSVTVTVWDVL